MNENTKLLLGLLRDYIEQVSSEGTIREHMNGVSGAIGWEHIFKLAQMNNVLPFVYNQIRNLTDEFGIDPRYIIYLKNIVIRNSSEQIRMHSRLNEIVDAFEREHIDYYILKGIILADLYPNPEYRYSCDIDIHIHESQLDSAMETLKSMGYEQSEFTDSNYEYKFFLPDNLMVELHTQLFEAFYDKHINIIKNIHLDGKEKLTKYNVVGREIPTLKQNELFIYVLCHMVVHFISTGINIRYLMDICIYVNRYVNELDFVYIMQVMKQFDVTDFVMNIFQICNKYLGMIEIPIKQNGFDNNIVKELLIDVIEGMLNHDPTIKQTENNYDKLVATMLYYKNKRSTLKNMFFPSIKVLAKDYKYLTKYKFLLPFAWVYRILSYPFRIRKNKNLLVNIKEGNERVRLLKKLDLL